MNTDLSNLYNNNSGNNTSNQPTSSMNNNSMVNPTMEPVNNVPNVANPVENNNTSNPVMNPMNNDPNVTIPSTTTSSSPVVNPLSNDPNVFNPMSHNPMKTNESEQVSAQPQKKGSVVPIILAAGVVIALLYFAFTFIPSLLSVSSQVNRIKADAFVTTATGYIGYAKDIAINDRGLSCVSKSMMEKVYLSDFDVDSDSMFSSPFGGKMDQDSSYVIIEAYGSSDQCTYKSSIYVTDGTYSLGADGDPISESEINYQAVKKN